MADRSPQERLEEMLAARAKYGGSATLDEVIEALRAEPITIYAAPVINVSTVGRSRVSRARGRPRQSVKDDLLQEIIREIVMGGGLTRSHRKGAPGISFRAAAKNVLHRNAVPEQQIPAKIQMLRRLFVTKIHAKPRPDGD